MHDHSARGNDFFKCDFCRRPWAEDLPMIEGHRGSLICADCLASAYRAIVLGDEDARPRPGETCVMCLERRDEPHYRARGPAAGGADPEQPVACACRRCVRQSASALERDPDSGWRKPRSA